MSSFKYFKTIVRDEFDAILEEIRESKFIALLVLLAVVALIFYLKPFPQKHITFATSYDESDGHQFAVSASERLKENSVIVKVLTTEGAVNNAELLNDLASGVNAGFTYGAALNEEQIKGIYSLGSVGYEPIWIFYKKNRLGKIEDIRDIAKYRVGLGPIKSGSYILAKKLFETNHIDVENNPHFKADSFVNTQANFLNGNLDVYILVSSYLDPIIQKLIKEPGVVLFSFKKSGAYVKKFNYFEAIDLPAGSMDVYNNIPNEDVSLIATTTTLAVRKDMHPDLQLALLMASKDVNRSSPLLFFAKRNEFPSYVDPLIPISPVAQRFYDYGPPHAMRYLPYWIAGFMDRAWILLLTMFAIIFPISKLNLHLRKLRYTVKERPHYEELLTMERRLCKETLTAKQKQDMLKRLNEINSHAIDDKVPVGEEFEYFAFLNAVDLLRHKLEHP